MNKSLNASLKVLAEEYGNAAITDAMLTLVAKEKTDVVSKVDRLAQLEKDAQTLQKEADSLKADLLTFAEADLKNTKIKKTVYFGSNGSRVIVQQTDTLKVLSEAVAKKILGDVFSEYFTESTSYTPTATLKKVLIPVINGDYTLQSTADVLKGLTKNEDKLKVLNKKIKGKYDSDVCTLQAVLDLQTADAEYYAYFLQEAKVFDNVSIILNAAGYKPGTEEFNTVLQEINSAFLVENGLKLTVEYKEG
jgi:hypothetical protein